MPYALIGESPTPHVVGKPQEWLTPRDGDRRGTASRMRDIGALTTESFCELFPLRTNVMPRLVRDWTASVRCEARSRAEAIVDRVVQMELYGIVCLGRRSFEATCGPSLATQWGLPLEFHRLPHARLPSGVMVAYFPHTSGRSRFWNDPSNRAAGARFLGELARRLTELARIDDRLRLKP